MSTAATKKDLANLEQRIDKRFDVFQRRMDRKFKEVIRQFHVVAENIHRDVAGANADEISLMKQKDTSLDARVRVSEDKVGV